MYNSLMSLKQLIRKDYTTLSDNYQIKLPLEIEKLIPDDDQVRLLSAFMEEIDLSELYSTYGRIRKDQVSPRQMFKIVTYASMNRIYSSRDIERSCRRDINFMYLLEGMPVPDHSTIARFISLHLSQCSKAMMSQVTSVLYDMGEISGIHIFIDGTKIESFANKYTFVWKKAVTKNMQKLSDKIVSFVADCETAYGIKIVYEDKITAHTLKRLKKSLEEIKEKEQIEFVHGSGKKKNPLQRSIETLTEYITRLKDYDDKLRICGTRNSYSKTDHDATFMKMKEDAMLNGQLKPGYNLQHGVDAEYIVWADVFSNPTDVNTLIPFVKDMQVHLPFKYTEIVADAGYESEENYVYLEENGQLSYIKPQNYEISKTRRYKQDISRQENMEYIENGDYYVCNNGRKLVAKDTSSRKHKSGYVQNVTIYECADCSGCACKSHCIKGNNCKTPMEERVKRLYVSKIMNQKRKEDLERITSEYGTQLRMNRSIQVEGSFADIKEDMQFRRYKYKGKKNVLAQSILLAIGHNINKLHHKIQNGTTGHHLYNLKSA